MNNALIVSAVRTPVGKYRGGLRTIEACDLAVVVLNASAAAGDWELQLFLNWRVIKM